MSPRWSYAKFPARYPYLFVAAAVVVAAGVLALGGYAFVAPWLAAAYAALMAARAAVAAVRTIRSGSAGVDVLAVIAVVAALAVGEWWAAFVIGMMLATGEALEDYAAHRARRDLRALIDRSPTQAARMGPDGTVEIVSVDVLSPGETILVRSGEVVPADAELLDAQGVFDESSLTGEPLPKELRVGDEVPSGAVNGASPAKMRVIRPASASQYQQIVALVEAASRSRAPMVRLADRIALPFTLTAVAIAGAAWWISGEPSRFAEVLVVATPCPLIIAAPVAFIAGMSRAAHSGIVVKTGGALEQLARTRAVAFDKTGTITSGTPRVVGTRPVPGVDPRQLLLWAAAVEQTSPHVSARAVVAAAQDLGERLPPTDDAQDFPGDGALAVIDGREVVVGKRSFVETRIRASFPEFEPEAGERPVYVARDGRLAGLLILKDRARPEAAEVITKLRAVRPPLRLLMLSGDERAAAERVARGVGIAEVHAPCTPQEKLGVMSAVPERPLTMVGDGVNDAPVLAAADIGIAMGAAGATAASDSADVVLLVDDLRGVLRARSISLRTVAVAMQSIGIGVALSLILMVVAAFGAIPALLGAWLQEAVDLASILWALRATVEPRTRETSPQASLTEAT